MWMWDQHVEEISMHHPKKEKEGGLLMLQQSAMLLFLQYYYKYITIPHILQKISKIFLLFILPSKWKVCVIKHLN